MPGKTPVLEWKFRSHGMRFGLSSEVGGQSSLPPTKSAISACFCHGVYVSSQIQ